VGYPINPSGFLGGMNMLPGYLNPHDHHIITTSAAIIIFIISLRET